MKNYICFVVILICSSCAVHSKYNPAKKYSPRELKQDYSIFRKVLEESHPGLYWYTPKYKVDQYFNYGYAQLNDSLTESKFRNIISYVLASIKCGHTSVKASERSSKYFERTRIPSFPLSVKLWPDTAVITGNLNQSDSTVGRGVLLESIDKRPINVIVDSMFQYLSADGYNTTHKYQTLSNPGAFRNMYNAVYGLKQKTEISFIDTSGALRTATIHLYNPTGDTQKLTALFPKPSFSKKERKKLLLSFNRNLKIDSSLHTAFMELNTFTKGNKLRGFFRRSFRQIRKEKIPNLVIDIRGNGGGSVVLSNLLTRYIADKPFKIADTLYALKRNSRFAKYEDNYLLNHFFLLFMTHKKDDGHYHFTYFENKYFKPKKINHFSGKVYILTSGNTFSAATIFAKSIEAQDNVITVGEETGGGAYGNNAWLIPDITLPNTKVRFRLPLFRLVVDKNEVKGRGVMPKVEVKPTVEAIRKNTDFKMDRVKELIRGAGGK